MKANGAPRILVVGGILRMQAALAVTLRKHLVVTTTSTASEALHRMTGSRHDLVILDSCLPDLKSATFLRALRAHRPNCRVIILAEGEENDALRELLDLRVDGIFPRSDHLDVLLRRINTLLRKRRAGAPGSGASRWRGNPAHGRQQRERPHGPGDRPRRRVIERSARLSLQARDRDERKGVRDAGPG